MRQSDNLNTKEPKSFSPDILHSRLYTKMWRNQNKKKGTGQKVAGPSLVAVVIMLFLVYLFEIGVDHVIVAFCRSGLFRSCAAGSRSVSRGFFLCRGLGVHRLCEFV